MNNISLRQLRAFVTVSALSSFTKAAHALNTTQPALSAQIRDLESELGLRLFDRNTRSVSATQAGRDLLPIVEKILADIGGVAAHAQDVANRNIGRVVIAALPSVSSTLLPRAVVRFRAQHPGVTVALKDALAERIVEMIRDDEVDFGVTSSPSADARLAFTPLASDRMVAVLPRKHPLAAARRVTLADLIDTPLILMNRDSSVRRIVDAACASLGRMPAPAYEAAYMATAIGMVRAGLGATLLPSSALEVAAAADLVMLGLDAPELTRQIGILRKGARSLSPAAESFVATLRSHAREWFSRQLPAPRRAERPTGKRNRRHGEPARRQTAR
jgi:LysR family transcriptional regulator, carnitine catabolism transcriptional activator